jgi:hypothetical protein
MHYGPASRWPSYMGQLDQGWQPTVKTEEARSSSTARLASGGPAVANVPAARVGRGRCYGTRGGSPDPFKEAMAMEIA